MKTEEAIAQKVAEMTTAALEPLQLLPTEVEIETPFFRGVVNVRNIVAAAIAFAALRFINQGETDGDDL